MTWYLVGGGIALLSLLLLAALLLVTWRKVKRLSSAVSRAGDAVGRATAALEQAQAAGPLGGARPGDRPPAASTPVADESPAQARSDVPS